MYYFVVTKYLELDKHDYSRYNYYIFAMSGEMLAGCTMEPETEASIFTCGSYIDAKLVT